jgi:hypothetical protein
LTVLIVALTATTFHLEVGDTTHAPLEQEAKLWQEAQAAPLLPHWAFVLPGSQTSPSQHPSAQVVGPQLGAALQLFPSQVLPEAVQSVHEAPPLPQAVS